MPRSKFDRVETDLKDAPTVTFSSMIKALIARARDLSTHLSANSQNPAPITASKVDVLVDQHYELLAKRAVDFCNRESSHCKTLRRSIQDALSTTQQRQRTERLVGGLNATLIAFREITLGNLRPASDSDSLIFFANECESPSAKSHVVVAGASLSALSKSASQKSKLKGKMSLTRWVNHMKTKSWAQHNDIGHLPWKDIYHCWTIGAATKEVSVEFPPFSITELLQEAPELDHVVDKPLGSSRKRKRTSHDVSSTAAKKRKTGGICQPVDSLSDDTLDASCDGIELLCSRWNRVHSIGCVLNDDRLSLRWYDAQGCIKTDSISIVSQLPLVVMALILFQRFTPSMWGEACLDISLPGAGAPVTLPESTRTSWELKGRHGAFATPVLRPTSNQDPEAAPSHGFNTRAHARASAASVTSDPLKHLFFKCSWRKEEHDSEASVIRLAQERAQRYLPYPDYVTQHLPQVESSEDYDEYSTRHIREYLNLDTASSRIPSAMVMQNLQPLDDAEPSAFRGLVWQVVRCLYLLWQIGIAHGDLSFWNIMTSCDGTNRKGVLIDFDHAAVMEPGEKSPEVGRDRIGTRPFIALDIGKDPSKRVPRVFRHDLESTLWCMLWYCQTQPAWLEGSFPEIRGAKQEWVQEVDSDIVPDNIRPGSEGLWHPVTSALYDWTQADYSARKEPKTDQQWLEIIHNHLPCPHELGTDWMSPISIPRGKIRRPRAARRQRPV